MKKYIGIAASLALLAAPAGFVFADDGQNPPPPPQGGMQADGSMNVMYRMQSPNDQQEGDNASGTMHIEFEDGMHASTTPWMSGEKRGLEMHWGTSTPPGHMASSTHWFMGTSTLRMHEGDDHRGPHATSTDEHASSSEQNHSRFEFPTFLQWLFGLPATTTVGQLKAQFNASTSVQANASGTPTQGDTNQGDEGSHGQGNNGIFARLFSFFGLGSR